MCPVWKLLLLQVTLSLHSSLTTTEGLITIIQKTATREEGSCITINCIYKAQRDMQLLWFKNPQWNETLKRFNGIIVYSNIADRPQSHKYSSRVEYQGDYESYGSHSASCTLRIKDLQMSDSGNYSFRYINPREKYMSEPLHLTINPNPCKVHLQEPQNNTFKENDTVTLQCSTSAHCQSYPEWHVSSSTQISKSTREDKGQEKVSELQLKVTWMDDRRTLSCRPPGSTDDCQSRKVTLAVEYAPKETKITVSSKDVKEGENVTLYCSSKAHPNASYMWYKNNTYSQSTEEYTLNDVKPEDSGKYSCQASNHHGKEDSTVLIKVKYAPKGVQVKAEPSDVNKGDAVRLTCSVQKSNPEVPQYSYRWYKGHLELQGHSNELYISSVTPNHTGWYHCRANNGIGSRDSPPTEISVKYAPEGTSIQGPSDIKLGSALHLSCSSNANPEADHYSWYYKSEDKLEYVVLSHMTPHKGFRIEKVALGHSGWYMCSSRNVIGAGLNSTAIRVHILYPPRQLILSMVDVVRETELLNIYCTVESYPEAKITLSRTSLTIPPIARAVAVSITSNKLTFSVNVSESYAGEYTCTAENSEGKNYTKQQLKVLYAPKDVEALVHPSEELKEGTELTLTCKAHSEPSVSKYTWNKSFGTDTKRVGQDQNLTMRPLVVSDAGNYFCTASNDLGTNQSASVQIRVKYPPHITIIHNLTSTGQWDGEAPVQLTCKADCYPAATEYKWYRKDGKVKNIVATDQNYTVQPQDPGIYFCTAKNEIAESTSKPAELFGFFHQILLKILISIFVICLLIGVIILVHRIFIRKRSDGAVSQSRFFAVIPARSSTVPNFLLDSWNHTRENLMTEEETDSWRHSGNQSAATALSDSSTNRPNLAGRPVANIHTVYDALKLPQNVQDGHHKKKDSTASTVNYANLKIKDPTKSVCSSDREGAVYAVVSKNKKNTKVVQGGNEDYENISGVHAARPGISNIIWDSSSSEEEETLNYTRVTVIGTPQHKPQHKGGDSSSDEDRTEYSQVKI